MFTDLLARLTGKRPEEPLPELDARLSVGALLVRLAKSDQNYVVQEIAKIDALLANRYGLNPVEAAKMRATCEKLEAQAPDTDAFTAMVQENVDYDERARVYDALWQVSMADGRLRPEEAEVITFVGKSLGIRDEDAARIAEQHQH